MIWYDLENAFGSVIHELLWYILELLGVPLELHLLWRMVLTDQRLPCSFELVSFKAALLALTSLRRSLPRFYSR